MSRRLPPLNALRAFEAAARLLSFSEAADELHVTQGAVSRHIRGLEDWLGRPLFERLHRRVELTPAGQRYLADVGEAFDQIARATSRADARQAGRSDGAVLRVNALGTFALRWLIPRLSGFHRAHPAIELRLATSHAPLAKLEREFDVAIRGAADATEGWHGTEFLAEARLPVASPALLARKPLAAPRDLRRHTLLHTASLPDVWPEWLALAGVGGLTPKRSLTMEHFHLTLQAALDGLGLAIGPVALVADDIADGRLVHPFASPALPPWRYLAFTRGTPGARRNAAAAAFIGWLTEAGAAPLPQAARRR